MIRAIFLHGSITNIVFINSNPKVTRQQLHKKKKMDRVWLQTSM
jgi:hypothetical protein